MARTLRWTVEELDYYANQVKDEVLQALYRDGVISGEQYKTCCESILVVNKPLGHISHFFRKFLKKKKMGDTLRVIAAIATQLPYVEKEDKSKCLN
jgi:hypothetical protein